MGLLDEKAALERSDLLPNGHEIEQELWGTIHGGRFDMREGLLFLCGGYWGFFGRDFEHTTVYAGFLGRVPELSYLGPPLPSIEGVDIYAIEGIIEGEGEQAYQFYPDFADFRNHPELTKSFFEAFRQKISNVMSPESEIAYLKAMDYQEMAHFEQAKELFLEAYRLDPRSALPPYALADLLRDEDPAGALTYLEEARRRNFEDLYMLTLLKAQLHVDLEEWHTARVELQTLKNQDVDVEFYALMAEVEIAFSNDREAILHLKSAIEICPDEGNFHALMAYRAAELGDWLLVKQSLIDAIELAEFHPATQMASALLSLEEGQEVHAFEHVQHALRFDPEFEAAQILFHSLEMQLPSKLRPREADTPSMGSAAFGLASADSSEPAIPAKEELAKVSHTLALFEGEEIENCIQRLDSWLEQFALEWGIRFCSLPENKDEELEFLNLVQSAFVEGWSHRISLESQYLQEKLLFLFSSQMKALPGVASLLFSQSIDNQALLLDKVLYQLVFYAMGLAEGGIFCSILEDLLRGDLSVDSGTLRFEVQKQFSTISDRLAILKNNWCVQAKSSLSEKIEFYLSKAFIPSVIPSEDGKEVFLFAEKEPLPPTGKEALSKPLETTHEPVKTQLQLRLEAVVIKDEPRKPEETKLSVDLDKALETASLRGVESSEIPKELEHLSHFTEPTPTDIPRLESFKAKTLEHALHSTESILPEGDSKVQGASMPMSTLRMPQLKARSIVAHAASLNSHLVKKELQSFDSSSEQLKLSKEEALKVSMAKANMVKPILSNPSSAKPSSPQSKLAATGSISQNLARHAIERSLQKNKVKKDDMYLLAFREYLTAFETLGMKAPNISKQRFSQFLRHKVEQWEKQNNKKALCYVRIENGKPQVKIREK